MQARNRPRCARQPLTCVGFVLREIEDFFAGARLEANHEYDPGIGGERRSLVEQFYNNIDFTSPVDVRRVLAAYSDIISCLEREQVDPLLRRLKRDGFILDADGRFKIGSLDRKGTRASSGVHSGSCEGNQDD